MSIADNPAKPKTGKNRVGNNTAVKQPVVLFFVGHFLTSHCQSSLTRMLAIDAGLPKTGNRVGENLIFAFMKIIKIISMFFLLIGLASFDSIQPVLDLKYNSIARKQDKPTLKKVKVRLRWHGIGGPGNACWKTNRDCGDCPGLCVLIEFRLGNITQQEKDDGDGYVDLTLDGNSLIFEPEASVDDGRGKVTITEDYFIGSAVSGLLGKNRVIIKAGDFDIDYKQGLGFGRVVFNAITE